MNREPAPPRTVSQHELHGDAVTLTEYRYTPRGQYKAWEAKFAGPDRNETEGRVQIWYEHIRMLKTVLGPDWKPSESEDWQPFPQRIDAVLEYTQKRGLRIQSVVGRITAAV